MAVGRYRIVFHVGGYFARLGVPLADPPFLDRVPVDEAQAGDIISLAGLTTAMVTVGTEPVPSASL